MSTEVVKTGGELERHEPSMMEVLSRAAADPKVDVAKLQALLDMQERVQRREAEVEFNAALARLMPKLPRVEKDGVIFNKGGTSVRSRYATYESIDLAIRPLLAEEGFSIGFDTDDSVPRMLRITATLSHRMGHGRKSQITLPTENPVISGAQAVGATVSYGRRYLVCSLLNIVCVGEDSDGVDLKTITEDQVLTLETLLTDTASNRARFLAWAGVEKLGEILAKNFSSAVKALESKRRQ